MMKHKIEIPADINLEELKDEIANGSRFIVLHYCISIFFAITQRRLSPAFLIRQGDDISHYKKKYNRLTLILGWWGLPWGPIYSLKSLRANKSGGTDVTEDIMLNLDEESLQKREVELRVTHYLFRKPEKSDLQAMKRALLPEFERDMNVKKIIAGIFINAPEPFFVIGFEVEKNFESYVEYARKALFREFYTNTFFDIIELNPEEITVSLFEKQGEVIFERY